MEIRRLRDFNNDEKLTPELLDKNFIDLKIHKGIQDENFEMRKKIIDYQNNFISKSEHEKIMKENHT